VIHGRNDDIGCVVVVGSLAVGSTVSASLTIDFNDTTQSAQFDLCTSSRKYPVSISAPVGELLRPHTLNEKEFVTLQSESVSTAAADIAVIGWLILGFLWHFKHSHSSYIIKQLVRMSGNTVVI